MTKGRKPRFRPRNQAYVLLHTAACRQPVLRKRKGKGSYRRVRASVGHEG